MAATEKQRLVVYVEGQAGGGKAPPNKVEHFSHRHFMRRCQLQPRDNFECAICEQHCGGVAYGCKRCGYYMHEPCINLPRKVQLECHHHPLSLLAIPAYDGWFMCNACGNEGEGFNYNCYACKYDLHVHCAVLPKTLSNGFSLQYSCLDKNKAAPLFCNNCGKVVDKKRWMYFNRGTNLVYHVSCAFRERYIGEEVADLISQASDRLGLLDLKN